MLKIIVLNDNRNDNKELENEHGLSLFIETEEAKILFDAGQTDIYINNAKKLNLDLNNLNFIILSHGDYDHGNGLKYLNVNNKLNLYAHNNIFKPRISKRTNNYDGLNQNKNQMKKIFNLNLSTKPVEITNKIIFLGEIKKSNSFEFGEFPMLDDKGMDYPHYDDSGILIKTSEGLVIVSGCAHSGICNIIEYAKKITGINKIFAVVGGFHLKHVNNKKTNETIKYLKANNVENVLIAHCTSNEVCNRFVKEMPKNTQIMSVGKEYFWSV